MKSSPLSKDDFFRTLFTLWLGPQQKLLVTLFRKATYPLMDISSSWDLTDLHTVSSYCNEQASLSLQPSFPVSPGHFAWILCCSLQMRREETEWPHITLRANYKSNQFSKLHCDIKHNSIMAVKTWLGNSHGARNSPFWAQRKMGTGGGHVSLASDFLPEDRTALQSPFAPLQ